MKKFRDKFLNSFLYCLAIELVEELLEELIAWGITNVITWAITKALSAVIVVFFTQTTKLVMKKFIKYYTYKEGNDKMNKFKKFFSWVNANKCTIGGIATGALTVISGAGVIDVTAFPELLIGSFNLTPVLYYGALGILTIVCSFFPETIEKFAKRIAEKKALKEEKANAKIADKQQKAIEKEAKAELEAEKKKATESKAEAEKTKAKEEAEKAHRAKVEEAKAKIIAQANKNQNA